MIFGLQIAFGNALAFFIIIGVPTIFWYERQKGRI